MSDPFGYSVGGADRELRQRAGKRMRSIRKIGTVYNPFKYLNSLISFKVKNERWSERSALQKLRQDEEPIVCL